MRPVGGLPPFEELTFDKSVLDVHMPLVAYFEVM
jgi:hypothetical protein